MVKLILIVFLFTCPRFFISVIDGQGHPRNWNNQYPKDGHELFRGYNEASINPESNMYSEIPVQSGVPLQQIQNKGHVGNQENQGYFTNQQNQQVEWTQGTDLNQQNQEYHVNQTGRPSNNSSFLEEYPLPQQMSDFTSVEMSTINESNEETNPYNFLNTGYGECSLEPFRNNRGHHGNDLFDNMGSLGPDHYPVFSNQQLGIMSNFDPQESDLLHGTEDPSFYADSLNIDHIPTENIDNSSFWPQEGLYETPFQHETQNISPYSNVGHARLNPIASNSSRNVDVLGLAQHQTNWQLPVHDPLTASSSRNVDPFELDRNKITWQQPTHDPWTASSSRNAKAFEYPPGGTGPSDAEYLSEFNEDETFGTNVYEIANELVDFETFGFDQHGNNLQTFNTESSEFDRQEEYPQEGMDLVYPDTSNFDQYFNPSKKPKSNPARDTSEFVPNYHSHGKSSLIVQMTSPELAPSNYRTPHLYPSSHDVGSSGGSGYDIRSDAPLDDTPGCKVNLKSLPIQHALFVTRRPNHVLNLIYPTSQGLIRVGLGEKVTITCANHPRSAKLLNVPEKPNNIQLMCMGGNLTDKSMDYKTKHFHCTESPKPFLRLIEEKSIECKNLDWYQMGIQLFFRETNAFHVLYDLCLDTDNQRTYFVRIMMGKSLKVQEEFKLKQKYSNCNLRKPKNKKIPLFNAVNSMDELFIRQIGQASLKTQLGYDAYKQLMQNDEKNNYLVPVQLVGQSDLVLRAEQLGAFYYANVQPMWRNLYVNSWKMVEETVREFAKNRENSVIVYSGVSGNFLHKNSDGAEVDLYLGTDPKKHKLLAVGQIFWKLVYASDSKKCAAIIGHNTPYLVSNVTLCGEDTTDLTNVPWLSTLKLRKPNGYVYVCHCKNFKFGLLPDLEVVDEFLDE